MKKTKAKSIVFLIITLLVALYIFFEAPNLNPLYLDGAVFWATLITIYVGVGALMKIGDFSFHPEDVQPGRVPFSYSAKAKFPKIPAIIIARRTSGAWLTGRTVHRYHPDGGWRTGLGRSAVSFRLL